MLRNGAEDHILTEEERARGRKKAGETHRRNKSLREAFRVLMEMEITDKKGVTMTGAEALASKAFQEAMKGNPKFWELVRDTSGQKPVEKVAVADINPDQLEEVQKLLKNAEKDT